MTDEELFKLALEAGFQEVHVERLDLEPYARKAGRTEDEVAASRGAGVPSFSWHAKARPAAARLARMYANPS